jgi:hypothetical protein
VDVDSDAVTRSRQLYSLLQPHAGSLQALCERLNRENPLTAMAEEAHAPKELVSLARSVSELPAGEMADLLEKVIAADKSGDKNSLDLQQMKKTLAGLEERIRSLGKEIQSFAKKKVRVPAQLPPELEGALSAEAARLERDITRARARMIKEHDLRLLRSAKVPADTIAAIVRDAPKQKDVDMLTDQLEKVRRLILDSAAAAPLAARRDSLHAFTSAARESLHPILDPLVMRQLSEFAQPIFKHHDQHKRKE